MVSAPPENKVYVGIDPGIDGAIAFYRPPYVPAIFPLPLIEHSTNRYEIDTAELLGILSTYPVEKVARITIEEVGGSPTFGGSRAFNFGKTYGQLLAVIEMFGASSLRVRPQTWKRSVLVGTDHSKAAAISYVERLFPGIELIPPGKRKPSHDFAEATCLAVYGSRLN